MDRNFVDMFIYLLSSLFLWQNYAAVAGIEVFSPVSHTLFNPADIIKKVNIGMLSCKMSFTILMRFFCYLLNFMLSCPCVKCCTKEWGKTAFKLSIIS